MAKNAEGAGPQLALICRDEGCPSSGPTCVEPDNRCGVSALPIRPRSCSIVGRIAHALDRGSRSVTRSLIAAVARDPRDLRVLVSCRSNCPDQGDRCAVGATGWSACRVAETRHGGQQTASRVARPGDRADRSIVWGEAFSVAARVAVDESGRRFVITSGEGSPSSSSAAVTLRRKARSRPGGRRRR